MADKSDTGIADDELLKLVRDERARSVGFENDSELLAQRERALDYYSGVMDDVPSLKNRSSAVSTDVADAIETLLPDLIDIFVGGDDVATFIPRNQEDEEGAQQETDYVNFAVFQQNDGFTTLYTMFKDALLSKTGLVTYYWEEYEQETETFDGVDEQTAAAVAHAAEIVSAEKGEEKGTWDLEVKKPGPPGKLCVKPIAPEDFTVAQDTINLRDSTYCAVRMRKRAQELIAAGIDADLAYSLPVYGSTKDDTIDLARDTAGEHEQGRTTDGGNDDLKTVEVVQHHIRVLDGKKLQLWRVLTGANESKLLEKEKVDRIQIAAITPFIVTHRFYGRSVADLLMELQKINTAITRNYLDQIYFALNQRLEVSQTDANEYTLTDILRNEPGVPVRSRTGNATRPIQAGGPGFDGLAALEYFQTVGERRTGIVRAAQGLNPDTLHDTAHGALALLSAAQRRIRLIARIFAETGIKDLFLGAHAVLREHANQQTMQRLRGKWVQVDPTTWGEREDMSIEIGLGSGGKEADIQAIMQQAMVQEKIVTLQGGANGPIVGMDQVYALAKRLFEKTGSKTPETYLKDPQGAVMPPPSDPNAHKADQAQGQLQIAQQKAMSDMQMQQAKAQSDAQIAQQKTQADFAIAMQKLQAENDVKLQQMHAELGMKWQTIQAELGMKGAEMAQQHRLQQEHQDHALGLASDMNQAKIEAQVKVGGEPG